MAIHPGFPSDRADLTRLLFPDGVPPLWVPTLVFYDEAGGIDRERQLAQLHLSYSCAPPFGPATLVTQAE